MIHSGSASTIVFAVLGGVSLASAQSALSQTPQPSSTYMAWNMPNSMIVVDGYQGNTLDIKAVSADPHVKAIIWQTSKGHKNDVTVDGKFDEVFKAAASKGILIGGYHFGYAGNVEKQARTFSTIIDKYDLKYAALDIDADRKGVDMPPEEGLVFLQYVHDHTKRGVWPHLYTNRSIATKIAKRFGTKSLYANTTLWVASPTLSIFPKGTSSEKPYWKPTWSDYTFWQFTNDPMCVPARKADNHTGRPCPYIIPRMDPGLDLQVFNGSTDQLKKLFSWE